MDVLFEDFRKLGTADADLHLDATLVGEAEITALIHIMLRVGEHVAVVADHDLIVVSGDREELAEDRFQALGRVALVGSRILVEEFVIAARLQVNEARNGNDFLSLAEVPDLHGVSYLSLDSQNGARTVACGWNGRRGREDSHHSGGDKEPSRRPAPPSAERSRVGPLRLGTHAVIGFDHR